ncbi:MAG: AAA family ATPase, partial [Candidatus Magnetominusculus sp. LBB02]|nr:AAA family ATPase [Candidatus Magnetominusculus sp. LBB02]
MSVLKYYELKEDPFKISPDPSYYYPSQRHAECISLIEYSVRQREGFTLVTGEPGMGKTTLLNVFVDRFRDNSEFAIVLTPRLSPNELLNAILQEYQLLKGGSCRESDIVDVITGQNKKHHHGTAALPSKNDLLISFKDFLVEKSNAGKYVIIIIDEAHNVPDDSLEELRLLSNFETRDGKLLHIIFFGQPELDKRLQSPSLTQLNQRIITRYRIKPLNKKDTCDYINYRLSIAGRGLVRFHSSAIRAFHRKTNGIPRLINILCTRVIMTAFLSQAKEITNTHVNIAARSLTSDYEGRPLGGLVAGFSKALIILILAVIVAFGVVYVYNRHRSEGTFPIAKAATAVTPTPAPIAKAVPVITPTPTPIAKVVPVVTPTPTPIAKAEPVITPTPIAKAVPVITPTPIAKAEPVITPSPTPIAKAVPVITPTPTPMAKAIPVVTPTP